MATSSLVGRFPALKGSGARMREVVGGTVAAEVRSSGATVVETTLGGGELPVGDAKL